MQNRKDENKIEDELTLFRCISIDLQVSLNCRKKEIRKMADFEYQENMELD